MLHVQFLFNGSIMNNVESTTVTLNSLLFFFLDLIFMYELQLYILIEFLQISVQKGSGLVAFHDLTDDH
jgi:hypothetical protein